MFHDILAFVRGTKIMETGCRMKGTEFFFYITDVFTIGCKGVYIMG